MIRYYTKTEVHRILKDKYSINIAYETLWAYEKKGFIQPSGYTMRGSRKMPIYTQLEIDNFINKVEDLRKEGKVRI
ncbi:MAG: hypothetical protein GYA14_12830 [Ignavibacteria bacterium]|nr:hypothetical protein [Ignavibacteria bacterium]